MLVNLEKTIAYICPECSNILSDKIDIFSFSGKGAYEIKCPAHGGGTVCASIKRKSGKYIVNVHCPVCAGTHQFRAAETSFWKNKLTVYQCPLSGINIFYSGSEESVNNALLENDDITDDLPWDEEDFIPEKLMLSAALEHLDNMRQNHALGCICGNNDLSVNFTDEDIIISCPECGGSMHININESEIFTLLGSRSLTIE